MDIRESFELRFGPDQAQALQAAGDGHRGDLLHGDEYGPDAFLDAIVIAIGFECFTNEHYRESHGITVPIPELKEWIRAEADLGHHTGPVDMITLFLGGYREYIAEPEPAGGPS